MKINNINYESYIVSHLDGLLSPAETDELMLFLSQNPHIAAELEAFKQAPDNQDSPLYKVINAFKDILPDPLIITDDNFDQVCITQIEGDLNSAQSRELEEYLQKHPDKQKDYYLYTLTKLKPDMTLTYEDKEKLKKIPFRHKR
jgi:hypothetical protein